MQVTSALYQPPAQLREAHSLHAASAGTHDDTTRAAERQAFADVFGQTLFGQVLGAMRKTLDKPAYLHGGRTEEVFQAQLDQVFAEKLSDAAVDSFTGPIYDQLSLRTY
jgi:hypothetical protein